MYIYNTNVIATHRVRRPCRNPVRSPATKNCGCWCCCRRWTKRRRCRRRPRSRRRRRRRRNGSPARRRAARRSPRVPCPSRPPSPGRAPVVWPRRWRCSKPPNCSPAAAVAAESAAAEVESAAAAAAVVAGGSAWVCRCRSGVDGWRGGGFCRPSRRRSPSPDTKWSGWG